MKKTTNPYDCLGKILKLCKRLCMCAVVLFLFLPSAMAGQKEQNKVIDVNYKDASLEQVFEDLQAKTSMNYIYSSVDVKKYGNVTYSKSKIPFTKVLDDVLKDTALEYKIEASVVVIVSKKKGNQVNEEKKEIKGKVVDEKGAPLPGVSVMVKGTTTGVASNIEGKFQIMVEKGQILIVSFLGMERKEIKVEDFKDLRITLKKITKHISEVVVTGYQKIDKRELSSAVTTLPVGQLKEGLSTNVASMLTGKIAGLTVMGESSTAGAAPKIRIRGISSISGNREPLWVVDGVILEDPVQISSEELNSLDNVNLIGNAISSINPEDIERIDVLKDASATAIYGVRAANGVIVISTKKGKVGAPKVKYSTVFTINERPEYAQLDRMNSKERVEVSKEIQARGLDFRNNPAPVAYEGLLYKYNAKEITYDEFLLMTKQLEEQNTDWFDILYRTSLSQKHGVTVSGADEKVNYYVSLNYLDDKGNFRKNKVEQYNAFAKISMDLSDRLNLIFQLNASTNNKEYQNQSINPYAYAYNTSRAISCYNPDGSLNFYNESQGYRTPLYYNILNELNHSGKEIEGQSISFNSNVDYRITDHLKFTGLFSYTKNVTDQDEWFDEQSYLASELRHYPYGKEFPDEKSNSQFYEKLCKLPYGGLLENSYTKNRSWTVRASLNFNKFYNEIHNFNANLGTEARSTEYKGIRTREYGYLPARGNVFSRLDLIKYPQARDLVQSNPNVVTNNITNILSFYGTFTYSYRRKYIANFNVRADGSNRFGQDDSNKFLPVWSVSGRWNLHEESLLKQFDWINNFAMRASYGVQGNISSEQTPFLILNLGSRDPLSGFYKSTLNSLPNPYLKWEKTKSYNYAIDFAFMDNRISGSVDVYYKKGEDMIINKGVSYTTGSKSMTINAGDLENKGFDVVLNMVPIRMKNFTVNFSINGGKNINKVTKTDVSSDYNYTDYLNGTVVLPDYAINSFFSYKWGGLDENGLPTFKDTEEYNLIPILDDKGQPVLDEEGEPTYNKEYLTKDQMYAKMLSYSGNKQADIVGGFSLGLRYKNWSVNGNFSYSIGSNIRLNNLYNNSGQYLPRPQQNMDSQFVKRWRKPGDEKITDIPVLSDDGLSMLGDLSGGREIEIARNKWAMYNQSDLRVVSGDYLKLRNLSVKHYLSEDICKKIGLSSVDVRLDISNIFTLKDKKLRGQDPQQIPFTGTPITPPITTYTLGLNVTF